MYLYSIDLFIMVIDKSVHGEPFFFFYLYFIDLFIVVIDKSVHGESFFSYRN